MRIIGHMVTRNEMSRWLTTTLPWLAELCNGSVAVYDDQSDDDIREYTAETGIALGLRPDPVPPFVVNEGAFRWAAWVWMERRMAVRDGDWILCIDADELLLATNPDGTLDHVRLLLLNAIGDAQERGQQTLTFNVAEAFQLDDKGWPQVRTDGYWGTITACRAARWRPGGVFHPRKEGGGSLPSSWRHNPWPDGHLQILHLGYVRAEDRFFKHARYSEGRGHNPRHVASILTQPSLTPWTGMSPPLKP